MRRSIFILFAVAMVAGLILSAGTAVAEHGYTGVAKCKMCHKKEASGDQYGKWLASSHSKAYETLGTDAAKAIAAEKGLEGSPQELDECLQCHVTGHGVAAELLGKKYSVEDGVGCESCHGAGADYKGKKVMKDHAAAVAAGMTEVSEETCLGCHNDKSPTFKEFNYEERLKAIAHPIPASE